MKTLRYGTLLLATAASMAFVPPSKTLPVEDTCFTCNTIAGGHYDSDGATQPTWPAYRGNPHGGSGPFSGSCDASHTASSCTPDGLKNIALATTAVRDGDLGALRALLAANDKVVFNARRGSIQVMDCTGKAVIGNFPIGVANSSALEALP